MDTIVCVHKEGIVDISGEALQVREQREKRRRRTIQERRGIVEETLLPGASVSRVAWRHDVNQVFYWRKLYREGQLGGGTATNLLPVKVAKERTAEVVKEDDFPSP